MARTQIVLKHEFTSQKYQSFFYLLGHGVNRHSLLTQVTHQRQRADIDAQADLVGGAMQ